MNRRLTNRRLMNRWLAVLIGAVAALVVTVSAAPTMSVSMAAGSPVSTTADNNPWD